MKKTLAIICSLAAAVAQADTTQFTLTPTLDEMTTEAGTSTNTITDKKTDYYNSLVVPETNVGNGGQWTWTHSFELSEAMTLDSVQFALFAVSASGAVQNQPRTGTYTLTITAVGADEASFTTSDTFTCVVNQDNTSVAAAWTVDGGVTAGTGVVVTAAETVAPTLQSGTYTLSLNIGEISTGTFMGLGKTVYLNGTTTSSAGAVPEPATATLSLLALAGLAARRRRK